MRFLTFSSLMATFSALLMAMTTSLGVPLGAYMPCQTLTSKPLRPCSSSVGMLGRDDRRLGVVTPKTLARWPSLITGTV